MVIFPSVNLSSTPVDAKSSWRAFFFSSSAFSPLSCSIPNMSMLEELSSGIFVSTN